MGWRFPEEFERGAVRVRGEGRQSEHRHVRVQEGLSCGPWSAGRGLASKGKGSTSNLSEVGIWIDLMDMPKLSEFSSNRMEVKSFHESCIETVQIPCISATHQNDPNLYVEPIALEPHRLWYFRSSCDGRRGP